MGNNGRPFLGIKETARKFLGSWELELKPYLETSGLLIGNKGLNKKKIKGSWEHVLPLEGAQCYFASSR